MHSLNPPSQKSFYFSLLPWLHSQFRSHNHQRIITETMGSVNVTSEMAVRERLPGLLLGNYGTTSSALHNITFAGVLEEWTGFEANVIAEFRSHEWSSSSRTLYNKPRGFVSPSSLRNEHVVVGDETGVQGRWQENVGQVMSAVYHDQRLSLTIGDFRASSSKYGKIPDIACMTGVPQPGQQPGRPGPPGHDLRFVGELKVPWVQEHKLSDAMGDEKLFRHILGKCAI